jgi:GTP-binding protein Era
MSEHAANPLLTPGQDLTQQLTDTVTDFDTIARDLHYQQAVTAVEQLIQKLDLSPRERAGLETELQDLASLRQKLTQTVIQIAVFGLVGRGKSSILNALVGQPVFATGPLHGVTQEVESIPWQADSLEPQVTLQRAILSGVEQSRVELLDTPGIDEVGGESRQRMAQRVAQQADLILFVITGDLTQVEYDALSQLRQAGKPILLVFNKIDQYSSADHQLILETVQAQVAALNLTVADMVSAAAAPLVTTVTHQGDIRQIQRHRGEAQVSELKLKILAILQREGKALVALNTLLYADSLNQQLVARKLEIRRQSAEDAIWQAVLAKALAVAINPVLVADVMGGAAIDITLIVTLSRLYGLAMTPVGAIKLLRTIAIAMGGLTASELLVSFGLSSLKSLLGASALATGGLTLSPYVSVAITQAGVAGVATYAIGQVAQTYLANGAAWGPTGPKAVITELLESMDENSVLARIKGEIQQQLQNDRLP